jgi:hypothetical protein
MQTNAHDIVLSRELDDLLLDVRGLVLVRELLAERGATSDELEAHSDELARRRRRLAAMIEGPVRGSGSEDGGLGAAA